MPYYPPSGGSALTVKEVDGTPSVSNVDTITVSNGTLTDSGSGDVVVTTGGGGGTLTVTEEDGSPSVAADTIKFPNGTVTDLGSGDVSIRQVPTGFIGCKAIWASGNIGAGTYGAVPLNGTDIFDTDGFHDPGSNPSRVTVPAGLAGKYLVTGTFRNGTNETNYGRILKNGANADDVIVVTGDDAYLTVTTILDLAATDYVEIGINASTTNNVQAAALQIVKLDSGKVGSGVGATVYNSATQAISDSTETAVVADTEAFDTDGFWVIGSPGRFTVPAGMGGMYLLTGFAYSQSSVVVYRRWRKNGSTFISGSATTATNAQGAEISTIARLDAGDYVELTVFSAASTIGHASSTEARNRMSIARLDSPAGGVLASGKTTRTAGDITTASTTYVDATGMSVVLTTGARKCMVVVDAVGLNNSAERVHLLLDIDGASQGGTYGNSHISLAATETGNLCFAFLTDVLSAGSHTFKLQWKVSGGTGTLHANSSSSPLSIAVQEMPDSGALAGGGGSMTAKGTYVVGGTDTNLTAVVGDVPELIRVVHPFGWTPTHMVIGIGASAGTLDMGIYADDGTGLAPGALLCSTGNFASPGTGRRARAIATPVYLPPGVYWHALVGSTGSLQVGYTGAGTNSFGYSGPIFGRASAVGVAGTLPATLSGFALAAAATNWAANVAAEIQ